MDDIFLKKLCSLGEISKLQFSKILQNCASPKDLFLEPRIIKPMERIHGFKWLKSNNVNKIYKIESAAVETTGKSEIYMIYANTSTFEHVVNLIRSKLDLENPEKNKYHIILVPKIPYTFEQTLEELGVYGDVIKLYSLQWFPIHIDKKLLSMEVPNLYKNIFVENNYTHLSSYAKSLWQLSLVFGKPQFALSLGNCSDAVLDQFELFNRDLGETEVRESDFGGLILIDRNMDYPSALLTPGTYAALVNEAYSVECGAVVYAEKNFKYCDEKNNLNDKKLPLRMALDSMKDSIYNDIKNLYFTDVTKVLSHLTRQMKAQDEYSRDMPIDEIKTYVRKKLPETTMRKKQISNHLQAAETIINVFGKRFGKQQFIETSLLLNQNKAGNLEFLEELITLENNKLAGLRLMCLTSITQSLSESELRSFWSKYVLEYGFKYGYVYNNLIRTSLVPEPTNKRILDKVKNISKQSKINNFYTSAYRLNQIPGRPHKIDLASPKSSSYVFAGYYKPLISVICNMVIERTSLNRIKSNFEQLGTISVRNDKCYPLKRRSLLVCVIGGISYAEIAALNLLESRTKTQITILTDRVISGNDIIESMF